jgi:hypothetical protein
VTSRVMAVECIDGIPSSLLRMHGPKNKTPLVVFGGFFYIYFAHTTGWPLLNDRKSVV